MRQLVLDLECPVLPEVKSTIRGKVYRLELEMGGCADCAFLDDDTGCIDPEAKACEDHVGAVWKEISHE